MGRLDAGTQGLRSFETTRINPHQPAALQIAAHLIIKPKYERNWPEVRSYDIINTEKQIS